MSGAGNDSPGHACFCLLPIVAPVLLSRSVRTVRRDILARTAISLSLRPSRSPRRPDSYARHASAPTPPACRGRRSPPGRRGRRRPPPGGPSPGALLVPVVVDGFLHVQQAPPLARGVLRLAVGPGLHLGVGGGGGELAGDQAVVLGVPARELLQWPRIADHDTRRLGATELGDLAGRAGLVYSRCTRLDGCPARRATTAARLVEVDALEVGDRGEEILADGVLDAGLALGRRRTPLGEDDLASAVEVLGCGPQRPGAPAHRRQETRASWMSEGLVQPSSIGLPAVMPSWARAARL